MMLPTYQRQLILLGSNSTLDNNNIQVHRFHHPISVFTNLGQNVAQTLVCRNGLKLIKNYYKRSKMSWSLNFGVNSLDLERLV